MNTMVAIGSYGQPTCVDALVRMIRARCGDIPILVSDDYSETNFDPAKGTDAARGRRVKEHLMEVVVRHGLIFRHSGTARIGHAGGDLGAYWHGLHYAREKGIEFLWKLSQRFLIDVPNWMETAVRQMNKVGAATACAPCHYGDGVNTKADPRFHLRTECIGFRVAAWARPDILPALIPRRLNYAAEQVIAEGHVRAGNNGPFVEPSWLNRDRTKRVPDCAWKDNRPEDLMTGDYHALFKKYGVEPGEDFHAGHSVSTHGFLWG